MKRPIRSLLFSTLFPSCARPVHGVFVETRLRELLKLGGVQVRVVAPVPWFPSAGARWGAYARMAATPERETRNGIEVLHPRYLVLPKLGMTIAPLTLALGAANTLRRLRREGFDFDLIDAHYYYPDGVAAALLAKWFDRPLLITARGSDINQIAGYALPRQMMRWASTVAAKSICVSAALAEALTAMGAPVRSVAVLRNGVDTEMFRPLERAPARLRLGLAYDPLLLSVGNLLDVKRHHLGIQALAAVRRHYPNAGLVIVGDGPSRPALERVAREAGTAAAVTFAGQVGHEQLCWWFSAADLSILASAREGWPNVLLESMACGTPVVASRVGGVPEIIDTECAGRAVDITDAESLANALLAELERPVDRDAIRRQALRRSWSETSRGQMEVFEAALATSGHGRQVEGGMVGR